MLNSIQPTYDAISIPSKPKNSTTIRNVLLTITAILFSCFAAYFLYSGYFVANKGVHVASHIRLSSEPIIIEYDAENVDDDVEPGTDEWIQFHDKLMEDAGYNAAELRSNPDVTVSFVAYDAVHATGDILQNRPSASITCFTQYSETGNTNAQKCLSTRKIDNPIRTGCSARHQKAAFSLFSGAFPVGTTGCESTSRDDIVSARCCQPTPDSEYEGADWAVNAVTNVLSSEAGCISVGCEHSQVSIGCSIKQSGLNSGLGGVQNEGNVCKGQRYGNIGDLSVGAMCADQPQDGHTLRCESVMSMDAKLNGETYESKVQCPIGTVMFDCNSFLNGRMSDCTEPSANTGELFGEYYYKKRRRSKVFCMANGDNQSLRAQATCCELV